MPEQQNIEWKQSWRDEYLQWISGFSNANGGVLYIGKDDNGNVVGVDKYKKLMDELPNKIKDTTGIICGVNLHKENNKYFIEIIIEPFSSPVSYKGKFYMRSGSTNQLLTGTALNNFLIKTEGKDWDEVVLIRCDRTDFDLNTIESFKKNAVKSGRLPYIGDSTPEEVLKNLNLIDKESNYKRASILLFGKNTQEYIRSAYVKVGRFGESSSDLQSQEVVEGNAFEIADKVIRILDDKYVIRNISYEGMHRVETPEYPFKAIREALLNAIIHREYEKTPIFLSLFDDRMTLMNQGELTDKLKIEDLKVKHLSYPRNELVASVFYKAGFIETWGRGTITIIEECEKYGLPEPKIEVYGGAFSITIFRDIYSDKYLSELDINERQKKVIQYIKENKEITSGEYQKEYDVSKATARRDIEELLELSIIKPEGTGRATKYVIDVEGYNTKQ